MKKYISKIFLILWFTSCCYVFFSFIQSGSNMRDGEVSTLYFLKMFFLSPLGVLCDALIEWLINSISAIFDIQLSNYFSVLTGHIISWIFMVIIGFFQWFFLLPKLFLVVEKKLNSFGKN